MDGWTEKKIWFAWASLIMFLQVKNIRIGVGHGMEMDLYKSRILDGVLMGFGTKTKLYKPVS